jgi:hypothetical protein
MEMSAPANYLLLTMPTTLESTGTLHIAEEGTRRCAFGNHHGAGPVVRSE